MLNTLDHPPHCPESWCAYAEELCCFNKITMIYTSAACRFNKITRYRHRQRVALAMKYRGGAYINRAVCMRAATLGKCSGTRPHTSISGRCLRAGTHMYALYATLKHAIPTGCCGRTTTSATNASQLHCHKHTQASSTNPLFNNCWCTIVARLCSSRARWCMRAAASTHACSFREWPCTAARRAF